MVCVRVYVLSATSLAKGGYAHASLYRRGAAVGSALYRTSVCNLLYVPTWYNNIMLLCGGWDWFCANYLKK